MDQQVIELETFHVYQTCFTHQELFDSAKNLVRLLKACGYTLGVAESCTGGLIAQSITRIPGSSEVFKGSIVCYQTPVKIELLKVDSNIINTYGVVSTQTAQAMAIGAFQLFNTNLVCSITGFAGPGGGDIHEPEGSIYISCACKDSCEKVQIYTQHIIFHMKNQRDFVRDKSTIHILNLLSKIISNVR